MTTRDGGAPLTIRDVPEPAPRGDEIVVGVRAGSLNRNELPRAMEALRDRQVRGKVVFTTDPS